MSGIVEIFNTIFTSHPWHPMVVHFPVGLTGGALFFFLLSLVRKNPYLERAAYYSISLAAVSTAVAGILGERDNMVRYGGMAPYIPIKIALASFLLVLTAATAIVRSRQGEFSWRRGAVLAYLAAYLVSFLLAGSLGFIGGLIVFGS